MDVRGTPVATRLVVSIWLLVLAPIVILFFLTRMIVTDDAFERQEAQLRSRAKAELQMIVSGFERVSEKTRSDLVFARYVMRSRGPATMSDEETLTIEAINQITRDSSTVTIPRMEIGRTAIAFDYEIVDEIQSWIGGTATIFQMIPDGMLRISTNVQTLAGTRAVGTYIPTDSPVYQTVSAGERYYGRAYVVNAWYITAYEPIFDADGAVIGSLYVGVRERAYQDQLLAAMADVRIGASGYIFVLDEDGAYVLSLDRARDGENIYDAQDAGGNFFIREMIDVARVLEGDDTAISYYPWQNIGEARPRDKLASLVYFEPWHWTIGISAYRDDVLASVQTASRAILLVALTFVVVGFVVALLIARTVSRPLRALTDTLTTISEGNLTTTTPYSSRTLEFNQLKTTLETVLLVNLRSTLKEVRRTSIQGNQLSDTLTDDSRKTSASGAAVTATANGIQVELTKLAGKIKNVENAIEQINAGIGRLKGRIESQTVAVTESSASIEEMAASIDNVAAIARRESESSRELLTQVSRGESALAETDKSIGDVSQYFESIQEMVTVIDSIAASTNLLAMNAAIEAAHAGEAGRGFAVVADEIRKLAGDTAENAKNIATTIKDVISGIERSIATSRASGEVYGAISAQAQTFVHAFEEISSATIEVSQGTRQTLDGVAELRDSSQEITDTSGTIQTSSDEIRASIVDISQTIDTAVTDYSGMETALNAIESAQKEMERLSSENSSLMGNLMRQIEFFKILCEEEEKLDEGCVDD